MIHDDDALQSAHDLAPASSTNEKHVAAEQSAPRKKQRRGFAAMSPEKQKEIASLGGKAAHAKGTAHEFSPEEAREAGRKGGQAAQRARQTVKH
jgi:general stress protein YciG